MRIMDMTMEEIINAVAKHNIRWIRKNFYTYKFEEKLLVNELLAELPELYTADEGKSVNLPNSLTNFYTQYYANAPKQIEELKEKLVKEFIDDKRILLLHENLSAKSIAKVQMMLADTSTGSLTLDTFELSSETESLIGLLEKNSKFNFAIICLTKLNDKFAIVSMLMFLIGYFGAGNICVIYDNEDTELFKIANKLGIPCDSYMGLGLR